VIGKERNHPPTHGQDGCANLGDAFPKELHSEESRSGQAQEEHRGEKSAPRAHVDSAVDPNILQRNSHAPLRVRAPRRGRDCRKRDHFAKPPRFHRTILKEMVNLLTAVGRIKINAHWRERRDGRVVWVKRRRTGSEQIARVANWFFRLAHDPIHVCAEPDEWQHWEICCFDLLYDHRFRAVTDGPRSVCFDQVPGLSLQAHAERGTLSTAMLMSAGREFRRAHGLWCEQMGAFWSHGDAQLGNVIYEAARDRCRLIDFEVIHDPGLPANVRRAQDLRVFLLDLAGAVEAARWLPFALAFVRGYARVDVLVELQRQLRPRHGVAGLWQRLRASDLTRTELRERMATLRRGLSPIILSSAEATRNDSANGPLPPFRDAGFTGDLDRRPENHAPDRADRPPADAEPDGADRDCTQNIR